MPAQAITNLTIGFVAVSFTCIAIAWHVQRLENRHLCIDNLKRIEKMKDDWAMINIKGFGAAPTMSQLQNSEIARFPGMAPVCPDGGTYSIGRIGDWPRCSIPLHRLP